MTAVLLLRCTRINQGYKHKEQSSYQPNECPIPDSYKQRVINATDTDTIIVTGRKSGHPVRSLRNAMLEKYLSLENNNTARRIR